MPRQPALSQKLLPVPGALRGPVRWSFAKPPSAARLRPIERFSVVDAVFAPVFRYFDVFDTLTGHGIFAATPEIRAWRAALAARGSVRAAVDPDYPERLRDFLDKKAAWIGRSIAGNDGIQPKKSYLRTVAHN